MQNSNNLYVVLGGVLVTINQNKEKTHDGLYIVKNGEKKAISAPLTGFGKTIISWEAGKPTRAEHHFSEKI